MKERKPVIEYDLLKVDEYNRYWEHEYQAHFSWRGKHIYMASDSLGKLKEAIRDYHVRIAWISCKNGSLSYGQVIVDEYPYQPRY